MNRIHDSLLVQVAVCACFAGPHAYIPGVRAAGLWPSQATISAAVLSAPAPAPAVANAQLWRLRLALRDCLVPAYCGYACLAPAAVTYHSARRSILLFATLPG